MIQEDQQRLLDSPMSDVLVSPLYSQKPECSFCFLKVDMIMLPEVYAPVWRFRDAPTPRQPPVYRHPPGEGVRGVPGCRWKATPQVTISQGNFSIQFAAQAAVGSFITTLPGTGHSWPPTLARLPSGSQVPTPLSKPALGPLW